MNQEIERYVQSSGKLETSDLDWEQAKNAGLTPDEVFVLTYFSDIETQTVRYLKMLLQMKIAFQPTISAFLTIWNYEEFFHGHVLERLLEVCGHRLEEGRLEKVKNQAKFNELLEAWLGPLVSRIFSNQFPAVYMAFGAIQEMTTLRGYERLSEITSNPVLKTLCERIAKQERRHFAWYFSNAQKQLAQSRSARWLARRILKLNWVPVGAGVKSQAEVFRLFSILFPGEQGEKLVREIDAKMGSLTGLEGIRLMQPYFSRLVNSH